MITPEHLISNDAVAELRSQNLRKKTIVQPPIENIEIVN